MLKTIPLLLETMPHKQTSKEIAWSLKLEKLKILTKMKIFKNLKNANFVKKNCKNLWYS